MTKTRKKQRSTLAKVINALMVILTVIVCTGLIVSAYSGWVSPLEFRYAPLAMMTFPIWATAIAVLAVLELIWWRRTFIMVLIAVVICLPQLSDFCPVHIPKGKMDPEEQAKSFTLMSYNVWNFFNQDPYATRDGNEQIDYILSLCPDIVCIQESHCLAPSPENEITQEQLRHLNEAYPYIYLDGESLALLSKYEATPIPVNFPRHEFESGEIAGWRMTIDGEVINLFVVHLRSFHFSYGDRDLFKEMTTVEEVKPKYIKEAKADLLPKITTSSIERTEQVELLLKYIEKYGGENVIVCGDFNDPVGCYGLHMLGRDAGLRQAYSTVGFGPMITYNANHFYFRIDHILYRGCLKPWSMSRGKLKASDHYPLMVTFVVN